MPDKILEEINNLINLTNSNKINWTLQQPNNFNIIKWDRTIDDKNYTITIQRQPLQAIAVRPGMPIPAASYFFFFTIIKTNPQPVEILMQLNTQTDSQYKDILTSLYTQALNSAKESASLILNNLLKDL